MLAVADLLLPLVGALLAWLVASLALWLVLRRRGRRLGASPFGRASALLLVTAHPDDESMFFAPSLAALTACGLEVSLLCLSVGNADGKGVRRVNELVAAAAVLGVAPARITVIDHPALLDGQLEQWDASVVAAAVREAVRALVADGGAKASSGVAVLTFDERGVSGHCNHCATYRGVAEFLREAAAFPAASSLSSSGPLTLPRSPRPSTSVPLPPVACYALESVSLLRKFSSVADVGLSLLLHLLRDALQSMWRPRLSQRPRRQTSDLTSYEGPTKAAAAAVAADLDDGAWPPHVLLCGAGIVRTDAAMRAHVSQYVWWRRLFVCSSRYSLVNSLVRMRPPPRPRAVPGHVGASAVKLD